MRNFRRFLACFFGSLIFPVLFMYRAFSEQVEDLDVFKRKIVADELDPADNKFLGGRFPLALCLWVLIYRWTKIILQ